MIHEKTFRDRLAALAGERGCATFGRKTGISEKTIRHHLRGDSLPPLRNLEKIAKTNGVTIGWLIGEDPHLQSFKKPAEVPVNTSMAEISQWISEQDDVINYREVLKAKLAMEYPAFHAWLQEKIGSASSGS